MNWNVCSTVTIHAPAPWTVKTEDGDKTDFFDVLVPVAVTGINIALNSSSVYVGDEVDFTVSVLPEDATDKSYELTTTTADLLSIEGKKVTAIKEGHASLTAKAGSIEKTINFDVKKPIESVEFDEIKTVLETALIKEKTNSNGGSWKHKKLDLTTEEKQYDWTVYTDSIQKRITSSEGEYVDDLTFIQANSESKNYLHNIIDTTSQTEANNKVKETEKSVGNGFSDVLKQDQANNAISMISEDTDYSGSSVYGISQYALNYLTETSSKGLSNDNSKEKAIVKKIDNLDNNIVYKIESKFEGDTSYYNEISFEIGLSGDKLVSFKFDQKVYNSNGYDFTAHALKTDAHSSVSCSFPRMFRATLATALPCFLASSVIACSERSKNRLMISVSVIYCHLSPPSPRICVGLLTTFFVIPVISTLVLKRNFWPEQNTRMNRTSIYHEAGLGKLS